MSRALSLPTASNHPTRQRMLDVLRRELARADRVDIAVSFLRLSGLGLVLEELRAFRARGGGLRLLTSTYLGVTQADALRTLAESLAPHELKVYDRSAPGFHLKLFVFEHGELSSCWVGSSNMTKGGLASNLELNVNPREPQVIDAIRQEFELLWDDPASRWPDPAFIAEYATRTRELSTPTPPWPRDTSRPAPTSAPEPRHLLSALAERQRGYGPSSPTTPTPLATPNEAQREALERLRELRLRGEKRAVIIAAPGVGKTFLAAFDASQAGAKTILFVSHRLEHLRQAKRTFELVFPGRPATLLDGSSTYAAHAAMVFASIQTLARSDLASAPWDYIVMDEFHHAHAPSYRAVIASSRGAFLLGLTATPERQDGHDVLALCDYNVAWEVRLHEAIRRRWLVPFHYFGVADDTVDYGTLPWRNGRFDPTAVEDALIVERRVELAMRHALEKGYDGTRRATVGFCAGRRHAEFMANRFDARGLISSFVTGDHSIAERERIYERFADPNDPLEWLFVADVLNEGVDIPAINSVLFLRPTDSATIFIQQLGRGLRLHPDCEVLTVVDLVGHHRRSWLSFQALNDPQAMPGLTTVSGLPVELTPPPDCEIILDDQTKAILLKVERFTGTRRERCKEAWERIRSEIGTAPYPVDFIGRDEDVLPEDFRATFGDWITARAHMGDAEPWERTLADDAPLRGLLARCESNWQAQRVYPYALLWGHIRDAEDPSRGFAQFFERFPRWRVEAGDLGEATGAKTLEKKLGALWQEGRLDPRVFEVADRELGRERLLLEVERRIQYHLEKDFRMRHGGVLRTPSDLKLWSRYRRPDIINHFGRQFDPARHNTGVLTFRNAPFEDHLVIITKLDTSTAQQQFHYANAFEDSQTLRWQSQNKNTPTTEPGRRLVTPGAAKVHLFVQERSHTSAVYCGLVTPIRHESSGPIDVWFRLSTPLPEAVEKAMVSSERAD